MRPPPPPHAIPALETEYRGVRYRSRLEARWAVFFDALGIRHEYEPQGYRTSWGNYLPDFWLPAFACFAEVKPIAFTREQLGKCAEIAHGTGFPFVLLVGQPSADWCELVHSDPTLSTPEYVHLPRSAGKDRLWYGFEGQRPAAWEWPAVTAAVAAARSARFGT